MYHFQEIISKRHALAREYAHIAHDDMGQTRKGSGAHYWEHPDSVSDLLEAYGADELVCIASELHDTLEDTEVDYDNLVDMYGEDVADLVSEVTNSPDLDGLSKEEYMSRKIVKLSDKALQVKLGDIIVNSLDQPRIQQLERMKKNIEYLCDHRKLDELCQDLVDDFYMAYETKKRELTEKVWLSSGK